MYQEQNRRSALVARAKMYDQIRSFFAERDVLEVETPLMGHHTVSDPYIASFTVDNYFLQTSPEYAMKRLLVEGSGSIFQICKAFRKEEAGSMHNPEFTMLEWYKIGCDHLQLMDEMDELLQLILDTKPAHKRSYLQVFQDHFGINPHTADIDNLQKIANENGVSLSNNAVQGLTATDWLQILMSHVVEPKLTGDSPWMIYDFPAPQAALAKVIQKEDPVAARFEVYIDGTELANGYFELQDHKEQRRRFIEDNKKRSEQGLSTVSADERLLSSLEKGLPSCAGVALGLDRLLMLKQSSLNIKDILSFAIQDA